MTGGTGVVGRRVLRVLGPEHEAVVLARSPDNVVSIRRAGATPIEGDLFDLPSLTRAMSGCEAVANLATSIPPLAKAGRASAWDMNTRIRIEGSANVVAAAGDVGVRRLVQESITLAYADGGDDWIDESQERPVSEFSAPVDTAEANAAGFGGESVILRFAQFYAADSGHIRSMAKAYRMGFSAFPGDPDSYTSFIYADDAAAAVVAALTIEPGTYNVADDDPPTRGQVDEAVLTEMGRSRATRVPASLVRRLSDSSEVLMRSHRISNEKLKAASAWSPNFSAANGVAASIAGSV